MKNVSFAKPFFTKASISACRGFELKLRIEKFEIKTESVKTSKSVSGVNSDGLTEKSKTIGLIQWEDFFVFLYCFTYMLINVNTIEKN